MMRQRQVDVTSRARQRLEIAHALADRPARDIAAVPQAIGVGRHVSHCRSPCCHLRRCRPNHDTMIAASRKGIIAVEIAAPSPSCRR